MQTVEEGNTAALLRFSCHPNVRHSISEWVRLYWRILLAAFLSCAIFMALPARATPIKPDLKKLLAQPAPKKTEYIPARAGWDGPEQRTPESNVYTQNYGPAATSRAMKASLLAAAVPGWQAVLSLIALIFLLRRLRKTSQVESPASQQEPPSEVPRAA